MDKNEAKIRPVLASGFRDYLPEDMIARQKMLDTIRAVFEAFGFAPLETPTIEREEILTGGDPNFSKEIFRLASNKKDKELSDLALRFDLTVPLARVVAANQNLSRPFKRYQIGQTFRGERAQFGRYKEFIQCDADIVGSESPMADAEIISLVYEVLKALGTPTFIIKINSRKFLTILMEKSGIAENKYSDVLRSVDKLGKIGWDGVQKELSKLIAKEGFDSLKSLIESSKEDDFDEFRMLKNNLNSLNVPQTSWRIDPTLVRGQSYYTGVIFEVFLKDMPEIGSIFGGGRYDGLVEKFSKDRVPAVGASIGVDRLFAALDKLGKINKKSKIADVLVLNFTEAAIGKVQEISSMLRRENMKTELYLGKEKMMQGQLAYAVKNEYPVVIIIGEKELGAGVVQIKDMSGRTQNETAIKNLVGKVKEII